MDDRVGVPAMVWSLKLPNQGLIVIIGVEVSEVCIGIGLPGKLRVEVLISFLQNQIVFVEGLWTKKRKGVGMDQVIIQPRWHGKSKSI